jgi:group I intron endonuclease|tara:strand:+ start:1967 stop:2443 length:477 start_codon:yes stop_codon:yes gene_type:complete
MIYAITNIITNDVYVGYTTKTTEERFQKHKYNARSGMDTYLYKAMRKYGEDNFEITTLQTYGNLTEDETFWIKKLEPKYNMTIGGEGGDTSKTPNWIKGMENRRTYVGSGNPNYGKFGKDNPKSQQLVLDGVYYESITQARKIAKRSFSYVKKNMTVV